MIDYRFEGKFEIGDRVVIQKPKVRDAACGWYIWNDDMDKLEGAVRIITDVERHYYRVDNCLCMFDEAWLERYEKASEQPFVSGISLEEFI